MELVEAALAKPAAERESWLNFECPGDTALIADVLERASWEEKMGDFLRDPIVARPASRAETFAPGALLAGHYRIAREIGRGRWSVVLEALNTETQQAVAIKVGTRPGGFATPPVHDGLVHHYEYAEIETLEGRAGFAVFEYLPGRTLADRLREEGCLPAEEAHDLARRLCQVLLHAAGSGFQPASLNTGDMILAARGAVLLSDWLPASSNVTTAHADLTSIGLILRRLSPDPESPAAPPWSRIVQRCLGQTPETRYSSLHALARDLERDLEPSAGLLEGFRKWFAAH